MITIRAGYAVVVDDEPANRDFLERLMQMAGFKVSGASSGAEALAAARAVPQLALALVDQELPDASGLDVIKMLRSENAEALLVMATMHDHPSLIERAFEVGVDVFLVKPHGFMELYRRLIEVDVNVDSLRRLIIDQYGPRPYKGKRPPAAEGIAKIAAPPTAPATTPAPAPANAPQPVTPTAVNAEPKPANAPPGSAATPPPPPAPASAPISTPAPAAATQPGGPSKLPPAAPAKTVPAAANAQQNSVKPATPAPASAGSTPAEPKPAGAPAKDKDKDSGAPKPTGQAPGQRPGGGT